MLRLFGLTELSLIKYLTKQNGQAPQQQQKPQAKVADDLPF